MRTIILRQFGPSPLKNRVESMPSAGTSTQFGRLPLGELCRTRRGNALRGSPQACNVLRGFPSRRILRSTQQAAAWGFCFEIVLVAYSDYLCSTWNQGDLLVKENVCHLEPLFMNSLIAL